MSDEEKTLTWMGRPLGELSKDELIEVIYHLRREIGVAHDQVKRVIKIERAARVAQGGPP